MRLLQARQRSILAFCLSIALAMMLALGTDSYAGPLTNPMSAIGAARSMVRGMSGQARDMTKLIAKLGLEVGEVDTMGNTNPPDSLADLIRQASDIMDCAMSSCTPQDLNDAEILIGQALHAADLFLELKIDLLMSDAEQLLEDNGALQGKVLALINNGKVRAGPGNDIINKIAVIDNLLHDFTFELEEIRAKIEDGDEGETPLSESDADDIEDWLEIFLDDPVNNTDALDEALLIIIQINADLVTLLKKMTPSFPDSVLPCLIMIDKILKDEQRRNTYRRSSSIVSVTLDENLAHFAIASEISDVTEGTVQLWATNGHLVGEYTLHGKTLTLPLNPHGLANGVYYYTVSLKRANGTVAQTTVQKLVVVR